MAQFDAFLKLDGVTGESHDDKHTGEIDIESWSWGLVNEGTAGKGGGLGAGKVHVSDLHITKFADKSSPTLFQYCANGKHISKGTLTIRKAGGDNPLEYFKIELNDILVSSVNTSTQEDHPLLLEEISLNFAKFHITYTEQNKDGSKGKSVETGWDVKLNKAA
jgi:type VI secretion system secreted protein Hcp